MPRMAGRFSTGFWRKAGGLSWRSGAGAGRCGGERKLKAASRVWLVFLSQRVDPYIAGSFPRKGLKAKGQRLKRRSGH